jgi:hypothetical protein
MSVPAMIGGLGFAGMDHVGRAQLSALNSRTAKFAVHELRAPNPG